MIKYFKAVTEPITTYLLYDGPLIIISNKLNPSLHETHIYMVETENIVFALKQIHFQTQQILPHNTDLMSYVTTKFVYIENFLKTTITSLYADLLIKQCELDPE